MCGNYTFFMYKKILGKPIMDIFKSVCPKHKHDFPPY